MAFFSFLSWFRPWWKSTETDYETVLARLTKDINDVQARLVRVNQRERRASVTLTLYAILVWLAYAFFVWFSTAHDRPLMSKGQRFQLWLPVAVGLLAIISVRSMVRYWFKRVSDGEERHLRSLQRARRKKVDEIKQATKYDHLRSLLEKYDDTASARPGMRRGPSSKASLAPAHQQQSKAQQPAAPSTPANRQFQGKKDGLPVGNIVPGKSKDAAPGAPGQGQGYATASQSNAVNGVPTPLGQKGALPFDVPQQHLRFQKTWLDRVADTILGVDSSGQDVAAEQRYALICHVCLSHNGLCPKEDFEEVQYICPRCGTFNSRRPSSVPVTSPWSQNSGHAHGRRRSSAGADSPARSIRDLPPSPSTPSITVKSTSATSGFGQTFDDTIAERTDGDMEERQATEQGKGSQREMATEGDGDKESDEGEADQEDEEQATRRNGNPTARKARGSESAMRKRSTMQSTGDESLEPMQID